METPRNLVKNSGTVAAAVLLGLWLEQQWAAHHDWPSLPDLDPSGSFGDPDLPRRSIALFGDSTITSPGLQSVDETWIHQLVPELSGRYHLDIDSYAVRGARVHDVLARQLPLISDRYDLAIVSAGSNDAVRGMTRGRLREILIDIATELLDSCAIVVLAGAGDIGTAPRLPFPLSLLATVRAKTTDSVHASIAAGHDRIHHIPMCDLTTETFRSDRDLFSADRFHPNRRGHAVWARAALPTIVEALAQAGHA